MCVLVEDDLEDGIGMQKGMDQFMSEANKETHVEITPYKMKCNLCSFKSQIRSPKK